MLDSRLTVGPESLTDVKQLQIEQEENVEDEHHLHHVR
jgi:hypothetical protein